MSDNDLDIIERVKAGDRKAYAMIIDKYEKPIFNLVFRMVCDFDEAVEITQLAFVKAYEKLESFNPAYRFFSWIYRIAYNESLNYIKKQKRTERLTGDYRSHQLNPEEEMLRSEQDQQVDQALQSLGFEHRVVLVLKHFIGYSYREISDILEIPEKTVKSRLFSARQRLKKQLAIQGYAS